MPKSDFIKSFREVAEEAYQNSKSKGFWENVPRNRGEMIALMHSELSEALEAVRKPGLMDDKVPEFSQETAEMADTVIRIMDYCAGHGLPVAEAIVAKMAYNATRPHKHGKAF